MKNLLDKEMDALVEAALYPDKNELIHDAFRALLRARPQLKVEGAIELYLQGNISFAKAAEISGLCAEELKKLMAERGVEREVIPSLEETYLKAKGHLCSEKP